MAYAYADNGTPGAELLISFGVEKITPNPNGNCMTGLWKIPESWTIGRWGGRFVFSPDGGATMLATYEGCQHYRGNTYRLPEEQAAAAIAEIEAAR